MEPKGVPAGLVPARRVASYLLEWTGLAAAAPFLLFPTVRPAGTFAALGGLVVLWAATTVLREEAWPLTPFNVALLLFVPMVGVGILVSTLPELTLPKATGLILGVAAFRAIAAARQPAFFHVALVAFFLLGLATLLVGVLGLSWVQKIPAWKAILAHLPKGLVRLPETQEGAVHPNELAGALTLYLPMPLSAILCWRPAWKRIPGLFLALAGLATCAGALLLTQSRSGWLGGAAGLIAVTLLWLLRSPKRWMRLLGAALPFLALGALAFALWRVGTAPLREAFDAALGEQLETPAGTISLEGRVELWSRALYAIQDFPFTGCGLGTFRRVVHILYPLFLVAPDTDIAHAHNVFLQAALDLGLPGLIAYLALLAVAASAAWWAGGAGMPFRWAALGLLAGLIGFHIYGLTDTVALGAKPGLAFWLALGILASLLDGSTVSTLEPSLGR